MGHGSLRGWARLELVRLWDEYGYLFHVVGVWMFVIEWGTRIGVES